MTETNTSSSAASRQTERQQAEVELNNIAATNANAVGTIIGTIKSVISAFPFPVGPAPGAPNTGAVMGMLAGFYKFLKMKPIPVDINRAIKNNPSLKNQEQDIDPVYLFAIQLALAIIEAIFCFIKALLNPLPIIGIFFPLCDAPLEAPDSRESAFGNARRDYRLRETAETSVIVGEITNPKPEPKPEPLSPVHRKPGVSFADFLKDNAPAVVNPTVQENPRSALGMANSTDNSANVPEPSLNYEPGNVSPDELRRLFGL